MFPILRYLIERIRDFTAKKSLEDKLGRKVSGSDIYSLKANIEAAGADERVRANERSAQPAVASTVPVLANTVPKSRTTQYVVLGIVGTVLLCVGVVVAGGLVFVMMPEATYDRLNPFTPKVVAGTFPPAIAGYELQEPPVYQSYRSYCECYGFTGVYKKDTESIYYNVYTFDTPEAARKRMESRYFIGGTPRVAEKTDSRQVIIDQKIGNVVIQLTSGNQLVYFGHPKLAGAINFENDLPYTALGFTAQPPPRSTEEVEEPPIQALTILDDCARDKASADTKYHEKFFLITGIVSGTGKTSKGIPFIAIQKPGTKVGLDSILSCSFEVGEADKIAKLKDGEMVTFRGKVNTKGPAGMVMIEQSRLQ